MSHVWQTLSLCCSPLGPLPVSGSVGEPARVLAGEPCWTPVRGCGRRPSRGLRGEAGDGDALSLLSVASAGLGQAAGKGVGVLWLRGGPCRPPALPTRWSWTLPSVPIWALLGHQGVALSVSTHRQDVLVSAQNVSAPGAPVPDPGGSQRRGLARWPRKPPRNPGAQEASPPRGPRKPPLPGGPGSPPQRRTWLSAGLWPRL